MNFDLGVITLVGDMGLRSPSVYQVRRSLAFPFGTHDTLSMIALIVLLTFTVDLLTSKYVHWLLNRWANFRLPRSRHNNFYDLPIFCYGPVT